MNKEIKKKIINIWGTKYEITHRDSNIINNSFSVCLGFGVFCCKQIFRKCLVGIGICMFVFLVIWEYIDRTILLCMYDCAECPFIYIGCNNMSYGEEYLCIRRNNFYILIMLSINNIWCLFIYALVIILGVYFCIQCFNYSICQYIEQLPTIENII